MFIKTKIDFMKHRHLMSGISLLAVILSLVTMAVNFLELGLDFTGGTQVEVEYSQPADLDQVRQTLASSHYADAVAQHFGRPEEVLVRVPPKEGEDKDKIGHAVHELLKQVNPDAKLKRIEFVGPQVGGELRDKSGLALVVSFGIILIYVSLRFRFKFAVGGVTALVHDVIVTLGFFSVTRLVFDLTSLAAILTIIGYSINDTIVVYDRIRENVRKLRNETMSEIINISLNETLSRTIMTASTVFLVLVALAVLGGEMIYSFAVALLVGVVVGTYSSVYVASNMLLIQNLTREDFMEQEKVVDDMP
ncbi:MAG: protein translocase subunit SecF [Gammaproteobacteria bacterium]|nr:protein translocase subunit SecF [Gammaproteobacteria bacterium]